MKKAPYQQEPDIRVLPPKSCVFSRGGYAGDKLSVDLVDQSSQKSSGDGTRSRALSCWPTRRWLAERVAVLRYDWRPA